MTDTQTETSPPSDTPAAPATGGAGTAPATPPSAATPPPAATAPPATPGRWRVTWYIGLSAILPLAGLAGAMMVATPVLKQQLIFATLIYAGLMVAFTGGMRWGVEVARAGRAVPDNGRLLLGGMSVAAAFVVLVTAPMLPAEIGWQIALATFGVVAVLQLLWDIWAGIRGDLPRWMAVFRVVVTALAAGLLSLLWWAAGRVDETPPPPPVGSFAPLPDTALPAPTLQAPVLPGPALPPAGGAPPADLGTPPLPLPPAGTAPAQPPATSAPSTAPAPAPATAPAASPGAAPPADPVTGPATTAPAPTAPPETRL